MFIAYTCNVKFAYYTYIVQNVEMFIIAMDNFAKEFVQGNATSNVSITAFWL